jgi:hypothetical protein
MKAALCIHGTVGRIYTNKKEYNWSGDVDYRIGLEHYKKHLLDVNDIDIFIHCWDTQYKDEIENDYKPKDSLFEKQIVFEPDNMRTNHQKSRWYSQKQVINLKKEFEKENNFKYDYVMVSRFDQAFLIDLKFSDYDRNKFWAPMDSETLQQSQQTNLFLDYWFFSNSNNMDRFSTLYDNWQNIQNWKAINWQNPPESCVPNCHVDSFIFAKSLKFDVGYAFREYKDHVLVRGVYENCQYAGADYSGISQLNKFQIYPKERF